MFKSNATFNHPNSISVIPSDIRKNQHDPRLGRASDLAWAWELDGRFKSLYVDLEAKLRPGNDLLQQDLVLTVARLIWIQRELMPINPVEANKEMVKVLQVATAQLTRNRQRVRYA